MGLMLSILAGLLIYEAYAWLPNLSNWLIEWAVRRLPHDDQERYREEWRANLRDVPNSMAKLIHAASHVIHAGSINYEIFSSWCD